MATTRLRHRTPITGLFLLGVLSVAWPAAGQSATALVAGDSHTCALTSGGAVSCWGRNLYGRLGDGTTTDSSTPVQVVGLQSGVIALAAGYQHTCALTSGGAVWCWGGNRDGQLGDGTTTDRSTPVAVSGLESGVVALGAGYFSTCAVKSGGALWCWGWNWAGQLGDGTTTNRLTPVPVIGMESGVASVTGHAVGSFTCARTTGGAAWCWGDNRYGQLGDGTTTYRYTPIQVTGMGSNVAGVTAAGTHACTLMNGGAAWCWGLNTWGNLGDGTTTDHSTPVSVVGLPSGTSAVIAGGYHTCALTSGGAMWCWGANEDGRLGDGSTTNRSTPVQVVGLTSGVTSAGLGPWHSCAVANGGEVWCWGRNRYGQLGDGSTTDRLTRVQVGGFVGAPAPSVSGIAPPGGPTAGGTAVTINGSNFVNGATVTLGGAAATSVTVANATTITAVTPAHDAGLVDVVVTNPGGQAGTLAGGFTYMVPAPVTISGTVTTSSGAPVAGVTIVGLPGNPVTDAGGSYSATVPWGWSGSVTPTHAGYAFWPAGRDYTFVTTDRTTDYTATSLLPGAFAKTGPAHGATGQAWSGTLTWAASASATSYEYCLDTAANEICDTAWTGVGTSTSAALSGLSPATTYSWQVRAVNAAGPTAADGDTWWAFTTRAGAARAGRDVDGDAKADVAVYRPATGTWFSLDSAASNQTFTARGWGVDAEGDLPVRGDFDGDGRIDPTVFRPATGTWFILKSSAAYADWAWWGWGIDTDTRVPGDYDGDGTTDAAVYRPATGEWFIRPSSGATQWSVIFGGQGDDAPVPGDYDGDGATDLAIYRPDTGTWFVLTSSSSFTSWTHHGWGMQTEGDQPVPADYDGDGATDLAVYRPSTGTWFMLKSSSNNTDWMWDGWGAATDQPMPADYDGDGRTDLAIYRPATGEWWIKPSSGATPWSVVFGQSGDVPLQGIR